MAASLFSGTHVPSTPTIKRLLAMQQPSSRGWSWSDAWRFLRGLRAALRSARVTRYWFVVRHVGGCQASADKHCGQPSCRGRRIAARTKAWPIGLRNHVANLVRAFRHRSESAWGTAVTDLRTFLLSRISVRLRPEQGPPMSHRGRAMSRRESIRLGLELRARECGPRMTPDVYVEAPTRGATGPRRKIAEHPVPGWDYTRAVWTGPNLPAHRRGEPEA